MLWWRIGPAMNVIECSYIMFISSSVSLVSVSSEEQSTGSGMDMLLRVLTCGFPCKCFNTVFVITNRYMGP